MLCRPALSAVVAAVADGLLVPAAAELGLVAIAVLRPAAASHCVLSVLGLVEVSPKFLGRQ